MDRYLTGITLQVLMPVDEKTIMKVEKEVFKMTGIDVLGIEFRYIPPVGEDVKNGA